MRKLFASAMLFLLTLLSVGSARCQARCSVAAMPIQHASANHAAPSMDDGMEHCSGMQDSLPSVDAACGMSLCQHQALPATPDARSESVSLQHLHVEILHRHVAALLVPVFRPLHELRRPQSVQRTPLDQSFSLRV